MSILCKKMSASSINSFRSVGDACVIGRAALRSGPKMVRALSVWADAPQFETTCVVKLVRHAEELGEVSRSCRCQHPLLQPEGKQNSECGSQRNMWDEKSFPLTGGHIQRHHCVVFPGNLRCCATADAVQDIIRTVAVVHALHPEPDPQVFVMEHRSLHIHERIRNNTTKLVGDILLRLGAETARGTYERRSSTPALEEEIASQVSWTCDGISNFNAVSLASAPMLNTKSREGSKDKPVIVNEDAALFVQRRENRPSLRLFVLTLVLCGKIRRQLCHRVTDERRHLPAPILLERNFAGERVAMFILDKRHVLHKLLHRGLVKSGTTVHTLNIPFDRGLRVYKYEAPLDSGHG